VDGDDSDDDEDDDDDDNNNNSSSSSNTADRGFYTLSPCTKKIYFVSQSTPTLTESRANMYRKIV
jgi:hypothetical protein